MPGYGIVVVVAFDSEMEEVKEIVERVVLICNVAIKRNLYNPH